MEISQLPICLKCNSDNTTFKVYVTSGAVVCQRKTATTLHFNIVCSLLPARRLSWSYLAAVVNVIVKHVNTGVTAETGSDRDSAVSRDIRQEDVSPCQGS